MAEPRELALAWFGPMVGSCGIHGGFISGTHAGCRLTDMNSEIPRLAGIKRPAAYVPIAMSFMALVVVALHVARFGPAKEVDEGAAAHLWQLLMVAQVPIVAYSAITGLRRAPREAWAILGLQLAAAAGAGAPVWLLGL